MIRRTGFTLIELMIVVAIVAIITTMGWKMFTEQGRTNNRTDAILATNAVSLALTQFQSDNTLGYVWTLPPGAVTAANAHNRFLPQVPVGLASDGSTFDNTCARQRGFRWVPANNRYESCRGLYSITVNVFPDPITPAIGGSFLITTTAIPLRPQAKDLECNSFTLDNNGVKGHIAINNSVAITGELPQPEDPLNMQAGLATADGPFHSTKRCWGSD